MTKSHILVLDDDTRLCNLIARHLRLNDFDVSVAYNAHDATALFQTFIFDALVMDVMMPDKDGITYLQELRQQGMTLPIIMLTALGDVDNRIQGLEKGADDYMAKPFEPQELILRLKKLLRFVAPTKQQITLLGGWTFDLDTGILHHEEKQVALTTLERDLLRILAQHKDAGLSREELASQMKADNMRTIDVQITRLRKKLGTSVENTSFIQTIRGQGYRLIEQ